MTVRAFMHTGAHGCHSAAVIIFRMDDPLEVRSQSWYTAVRQPPEVMLDWVAEQLTDLSTGTDLNVGRDSDVEGLRLVV